MERLLSKRKIVRLSVSNNQNNLQKIFLPRNANGISLREQIDLQVKFDNFTPSLL